MKKYILYIIIYTLIAVLLLPGAFLSDFIWHKLKFQPRWFRKMRHRQIDWSAREMRKMEQAGDRCVEYMTDKAPK